MQKKFNRGFTLIELLVVIAIIGILSSVVLASLNTARGKGADTAAKANLNNMRAQAEIFYDDPAAGNGSYTNLCTNASVIKAMNSARVAEGQVAWATTADNSATAGGCTAAATTYTMWVPLSKGAGSPNNWCVDNTGTSIQKTLNPASFSGTTLPATCGATASVAW